MSAIARVRAIGFALAALVYAIDQAIKDWLRYTVDLKHTGPIEVLPFFDLRFIPNYGVSLGMFTADGMWSRFALVAMTCTIALFVAIWMWREKHLAEVGALGLVLGGALGNIKDRAMSGFVYDYADLHFGEFRPFLVFNLADAAITVGVVIILARTLLSREKPQAAGETASES